MTNTQTAADFVNERLQNLNAIDKKIVSLLEHVSSTIECLKEGQINELKESSSTTYGYGGHDSNNERTKKKFEQSVQSFNHDLEFMSSRLRREIILIDKKTGSYTAAENDVTLLPISIDKKASWVGDWKFKNQINTIKQLLNEDTNFSKRFEFSSEADQENNNDDSESGGDGSSDQVADVDISTNDTDNKVSDNNKDSIIEPNLNSDANLQNVKDEPQNSNASPEKGDTISHSAENIASSEVKSKPEKHEREDDSNIARQQSQHESKQQSSPQPQSQSQSQPQVQIQTQAQREPFSDPTQIPSQKQSENQSQSQAQPQNPAQQLPQQNQQQTQHQPQAVKQDDSIMIDLESDNDNSNNNFDDVIQID